MRPRAGVDLDNVLYDWEGYARTLLRVWWGIALPPSVHYDSIRSAIGPERWAWLFDEGVRKFGLFRQEGILPDAAAVMPRLLETHDVVVLTRRPRHAIEDTHSWLLRHGVRASEVVILHDGVPSGTGSPVTRTKASVPCDWYVDDAPAEVEAYEAAGKRAFLLDRPWNQESAAGRRVIDWYQLMKEVA